MEFSNNQISQLRKLGVTEKQIGRLRTKFQLIRDSILGTGSMLDVVDPLKELHRHLLDAEKVVKKMVAAKEGPLWEAYGHLAGSAFDMEPQEVCPEIEPDSGELPEFVRIPTLLRLITNSAQRAVEIHAPKTRRGPVAPVSAIARVVAALKDRELKVSRGEGSKFAQICSLVFDAASNGKLQSNKSPAKKTPVSDEIRPDVDRAIRAYLAEHKKLRSNLKLHKAQDSYLKRLTSIAADDVT